MTIPRSSIQTLSPPLTPTIFLPTLSCKSKSLLGDLGQQASFFVLAGRPGFGSYCASNEHRFFVRVLRARETSQATLLVSRIEKAR